ncbi:tetratricopeptide repeat protein [bacterium]|nr:tetratricopeptide repeat protein [bacterium]
MQKKIIILFMLCLFTISAAFAEIANEARLDYNKGIDYYKLGQYEKAAEYFRSAINVSPDYIDAYYNLGSLYEFLGQYQAALVVFEQVYIRQPEDYEAVYKAASIAFKLGEYEKALKYASSIPRGASQYDLARTLANKIKSTNTGGQDIKVPLQSVDTVAGQSSHLFEGIQGPTGMVTDDLGNLYVACYADNSITKIFPNGQRVLFVKDKRINGPIGLAIDVAGNLYVANYGNNNVLKITKNGVINVMIANIDKPYGLYLKGNMLFISSQGSNSVLRYKLHN